MKYRLALGTLFRAGLVCAALGCAVLLSAVPALAQDSPAAAMMRLLKSGRVPAERLPTLLELVGSRGNAEDLGYIYQQCLAEDGFPAEVRRKALAVLAEAAENRSVVPAEGLEQLEQLIAPAADRKLDVPSRLAAIRLAGIWKVDALSKSLSDLARHQNTALRHATIQPLVQIGSDSARAALTQLTAADQPLAVRYRGAAALATLDPRSAAPLAAELLTQAPEDADPAPLVDAFLNHQG